MAPVTSLNTAKCLTVTDRVSLWSKSVFSEISEKQSTVKYNQENDADV